MQLCAIRIFRYAKGRLAGGPIQGLFNAIDNPPFRPSPEAQSVIVKGKWTMVSKIYHTHVAP